MKEIKALELSLIELSLSVLNLLDVQKGVNQRIGRENKPNSMGPVQIHWATAA
jgi:hypothetical protein